MNLDEKDVSTKQLATQTHPRVSYSDEHRGRARRPQTASRQRSQNSDRSDSAQASAPLNLEARRYEFPKAARLLMRREFLSLQQRGKRRHSPHFVVISLPAQEGRSRLGITATRRFGKAVVRNRMKRILREFFRTRQAHITPARDILIIPKTGADTLSSIQMAEELERTLFFAGKET